MSRAPSVQSTKPLGDIVRAVIFDLDGTLYDQTKLRWIMLRELLGYYARHPAEIGDLLILRSFRREREKHAGDQVPDLESAQYEWAARGQGVSSAKVRAVVKKWMLEEPLKYIFSCGLTGLEQIFKSLSRLGIATAVLSDYPAKEKLAALGISPDLVLSATDAELNCLKPDPKGLLILADKLSVDVKSCLLIGDREDRDGECARRAGMPYRIFTDGKAMVRFLSQVFEA